MLIHRRPATMAVFAGLLCLLSGCASNRAQRYTKFANAFLPATPAIVLIAAPPQLAQTPPKSLYSHETAGNLDNLELLRTNSVADQRIREADRHFSSGKQLYEDGNPDDARREFDLAMDTLLNTPADLPGRQKLERKLEQLTDAIFRYDSEGLGAGQRQDEIVYDRPPLDGLLEMTFPVDPKLKPKVKEELGATVSQLPLELRDPVLSFIHYFSTDHGHKTLAAGLRRAGRYRSMVERILAEEGVPQELIFLAQEESGFLPRARSFKSCIGLWQFAQWRGREYGLNQTAYSDDRMDPEKATRAAARHLRDLYKHFGDWYLAMAAYDCGPGCVDHAVQRTGYADFWELHRLNALPKETRNYVPLILAMTIMAKNPKDYGLDNIEMDPPLEVDTKEMKATTSLALVADATGGSVSGLEDLNPSLLRGIAPVGFALKVPKGSGGVLSATLAHVPADRRATWRLHRVEAGESMALIARRYGSATKLIDSANNGIKGEARAGQWLVVPVSYRAQAKTARHRTTGGHRYASVRKSSGRRARNASARRGARSGPYTASLRSPHHRAVVNR